MSLLLLFGGRGRYGGPGGGKGLSTNGLLANWDMSGGSGQSVADRSGKAHPLQLGATSGTDATDPTFTATGLAFTGTQYCLATNLSPTGVPVTILAVFQVAGTGPRTLVGTQPTTSLLQFYITAGGKLELDKQDAAAVGVSASTFTGAPFFGAVTYDGTLWKIYKGGAVDASGSTVQALGGNAGLMIGATKVAQYFFNGIIYQVLYYSRVLSDTEVSNAYKSLKAIWAGRGVVI